MQIRVPGARSSFPVAIPARKRTRRPKQSPPSGGVRLDVDFTRPGGFAHSIADDPQGPEPQVSHPRGSPRKRRRPSRHRVEIHHGKTEAGAPFKTAFDEQAPGALRLTGPRQPPLKFELARTRSSHFAPRSLQAESRWPERISRTNVSWQTEYPLYNNSLAHVFSCVKLKSNRNVLAIAQFSEGHAKQKRPAARS